MAGTKYLRPCLGLLAALLAVATLLGVMVSAAENQGSLQILCVVSQDGQSIGLSGDTYAIVQVADIDPDSLEEGPLRYQTLPEWMEFDCDWGSLTASELRNKAIAMEEQAFVRNEFLDEQMIDADGQATFTPLDPGMYLVVRLEIQDYNLYFIMDPFLVSVPQDVQDELEYDVKVHVKFAWTPPSRFDDRIRIGHPDVPEEDTVPTEPTPPPETTEPTPPDLPQTGQLLWPIPLLAATGIALIAVGRYLDRKKNKSE